MIKLKFYGLGGQGIVTAAKILSEAVSLHEGRFAITVPSYGHERRGAPVNTSIIIDDEEVLLNSFVYDPDIVLVMDHTIIEKGVDIAEGIKEDSILVLNSEDKSVLDRYKAFKFKEMYCVDGTRVAQESIGRGIPNSSMLGALSGTGIVKIESVEKAIKTAFNEKVGDKNAKAARSAYEQIQKI
ncbi:MAG: pyruvate ferredoxin oxidoreductase [Clostridia bacterium BRH_c25]|nr:MAG: pyruvate ferredoxin oxidoreductase [Clostridia bacterium BRH_c25]